MIAETAPWWVLLLVYPVLLLVLAVMWLMTRGSSTELLLKGFGVELTIKEDRLKTVAILQAPETTAVEVTTIKKGD